MVAMSQEFSPGWEAERERREVAELEQFAMWLMVLFGDQWLEPCALPPAHAIHH